MYPSMKGMYRMLDRCIQVPIVVPEYGKMCDYSTHRNSDNIPEYGLMSRSVGVCSRVCKDAPEYRYMYLSMLIASSGEENRNRASCHVSVVEVCIEHSVG